jgi:class 3 adenylate cyclase
MIANFPTGIVTFLFTDFEGSTWLWEQYPDAMQAALARHDGLLRNIIEMQGGHMVKTTGDGLHAVFARAQMDEPAFERSWVEGRLMTVEQAIACAMEANRL